MAGIAAVFTNDCFGCALGNNRSSLVATLRTEIDHPICGPNHVQIVLDDNDSIAIIDQAVEHIQQTLDIGKMQAGGRLVQNVDRISGGFAAQLFG